MSTGRESDTPKAGFVGWSPETAEEAESYSVAAVVARMKTPTAVEDDRTAAVIQRALPDGTEGAQD